jgi:hypothetical protein
MRRLEKARERLRGRLERRGVATVGLGVAVLSSGELSSFVPDRMAAAAVAAGTGGPVSAGVQALAGAAVAIKLLPLAVGLTLLLAGVGVAALSMQPVPNEQAVPSSPHPAPIPGDRNAEAPEKARSLDVDDRPLPAGAIHRLGSRRFRIEGRCDFILPTPDGRYVLIHPHPSISGRAAHGLMLLDADTGLRVRYFGDSRRVPKGHTYDAIRPAAFSPDGKKLSALGWHKSEKEGNGSAQWASFDNPCKRVMLAWDVATGRLLSEWDLPSGSWFGPSGGVSLIGVNTSPDGTRLYVYGAIRMNATPGRVVRGLPGLHVLDAATGKKLQTWDGAGYPAGSTVGGKEVITFRKHAEITAHDAQTGKPVRSFPLSGFVSSVVLSSDGKTLAAAGVSGHPDRPTGCELKLWESATGREIQRLTVDTKILRSATVRLAFAPDGKTLFLGTEAERLRKLIGTLDDATFAEREAAEAELRKLGRQAETELRKTLAESTSLEVKQRVKRIVDRWSTATAAYPAEEARELRAVWALELAGTAEAKKLLEA